jgi:hypothetical protein
MVFKKYTRIMNLQENIRRILREDHQFVRKHISDTNPHTGARNAFMGIPSLSGYDWDLIPKLIYPDDKKINKEMLYPASKRDVKRYMKQYIQGSEFPAIVLIDNGKEYSIADGQHRLSAAIKLGVPIYAYVGTEKPKLQESIRRILREETDIDIFGHNYNELLDNITSSDSGLIHTDPEELLKQKIKFLKKIKKKNSIKLFRVVFSKSKNKINIKKLGNHYVYDMDDFHEQMLDYLYYNAKRKDSSLDDDDVWVVEIETPTSNIDYSETILTYSLHPNEDEITIMSSNNIKIINISKYYE